MKEARKKICIFPCGDLFEMEFSHYLYGWLGTNWT